MKLDEILQNNFYRESAPEGHKCLTSCVWFVSAKPGEPWQVKPADFVKADELTPEQAITELQDVVDRDNQARRADHAGGDPLRREGRQLLEKASGVEGDVWVKTVRKYLGDRRRQYHGFKSFWKPSRDGLIREGWEGLYNE